MRCSAIRKRISWYIDDRLSPDEKKAFSAHIGTCPVCQKALKETQAVHKLFSATERYCAPYGFAARVMSHIRVEEPSPWWAVFTQRPLVLRALEWGCALLVIVFGLLFGNLVVPQQFPNPGLVNVQQSFSLDLFQAAPPDSISGAYLALAEANHEK